MQTLSHAEATARLSMGTDETTAFLALLLAPRTLCWPHASFVFAPEQRGRSLLRALEATCSEGLFTESERRARSICYDLEWAAWRRLTNCAYACRCDVLEYPRRLRRKVTDPEFDGRFEIRLREKAAFVDILLVWTKFFMNEARYLHNVAARATPASPSRVDLAATDVRLARASQAGVLLSEECCRSGLRDLEDSERQSLALAHLLRGEIIYLRETESVEVTQLRSLLALPVQELPRAVGPAPGRSTQTPKGWKSSRASDARSMMEYTPHADSTGPAPETPAVLLAMRHIEEYALFEHSGRKSISDLERALWLRMFEGHGDIVRHRAAEAACIAESRRDRVYLAHAVARGEVLAGLVDTEKAQRSFLRYEEECAWEGDFLGHLSTTP